MKRIGLFVAILLSFSAIHAQTWSKVNGRWQYQFFKTDSTFTPPQDTLASAPIGSIGVKNDVVYFKNVAGHWISLVGLSVNMATASLTANGNYTQNWNHKQLFVDSFANMRLFASENDAFLGRKTTYTNTFTPSFLTGPMAIKVALRNAANTSDSLVNSIASESGGNLKLTSLNQSKTSQIQIVPGTATLSGYDSVLIGSGVPKSGADSIFAVGPYNATFKTNTLYKIPAAGIAGKNIANAALTANDDYVQDWNNKILKFDNIKNFELSTYGTFGGYPQYNLFQIKPSTSYPFYIYTAIKKADDSGDSVYNTLTHRLEGTIITAENQTISKLARLSLSPTGWSKLEATDSAIVNAAAIRLYNSTEDIKYSTAPGVTPYATWKNAGRLLIGTTTDNGSSRLQITNATQGDFTAAVTINVAGASLDRPHGLTVNETSAGGGYGIRSNSTNGVAMLGIGKISGVSGTVSTGSEGLLDAAGVVGTTFDNTTAPAIMAKAYGKSASPNQVLSGLDLWRIPTAFPTSGGIMMRTFLPVYVPAISAVLGTPILANTITSATTNYNGPNYTTDLSFNGPKDSVYSTILTLKGGGQMQGNQYTGSNFETTDTSMPAAVFGTDGKIYRRRGDGAVVTTPTLENVLTAGSTLTGTHTWDAGTFTQSLNGAKTSGIAWNFGNSGNGTALGVSAGGTQSAVFIQQSGSGGGIDVLTFGSQAAIGASKNVSATNAIQSLLTLQTNSFGTAANGIGAGLNFIAQTTSGGNTDTTALLYGYWQNATHASRSGGFGIKVKNNAGILSERFLLSSTGKIRASAYGVNTFAGTPAYSLGVNATGEFVEYAVPAATPPGGSNTHVQFNNSGAFGGSSALTWDNSSNVLTVTGDGTTDNGYISVINPDGEGTYTYSSLFLSANTTTEAPSMQLQNNLFKGIQFVMAANSGQATISTNDSLLISAAHKTKIESERLYLVASDSIRIRAAGQATADSILAVVNYQNTVNGATSKVVKIPYTPAPTKVKFVQTATVSVIANDNELTLVGAGTGSLTIPANTMEVGKNYRVTIRGTYGTDASNPAQQNWRFYLGGTAILVSGNAGLGTNRVDKIFTMGVDITCRSTGSSGTVMAVGMFNTEDGPGAKGFPPTTTTINTTTNLTFNFTTDLTDGSAGNNCKVYTLTFEEI